ncbi:S24/S26 family peptidase [Natrialba swarupiae]|uniref:S26 family signal peptidase n=1 Tax=Natrialba swarupiae TaxID=2448032 RepID=A0A5D5AK35_9EURY|nr:S26 family signal peptidase [Natrialba swarupiae]TYT62046.1 S26 family signal peptidase [Natrialba swarupiae]
MNGPRSERSADESDGTRGRADSKGDQTAGRGARDGPTSRRRRKSRTVRGSIRRALSADGGIALLARDAVTVVVIVSILGGLLFAVSGIWPPLVAIESPSMEPNANVGDMVFLVDDDRFVGEGAVDDTGVVPADRGAGTDHETFGEPGDVIVFEPNGDASQTPIIHRAHFWVEEGDDWVAMGESAYAPSSATDCERVSSCPAAHDGFITKGDNNNNYDQFSPDGVSDVVKPDWVVGKGAVRIPWLGHVRLAFESALAVSGAAVSLSAITGAAAFASTRRRNV